MLQYGGHLKALRSKPVTRSKHHVIPLIQGGIAKFIEKPNLYKQKVEWGLAAAVGEKMLSCLISKEFQFCKMKSEDRLHVSVNKLKVKVESEKVGLKLNIQKTKIMASGPTTSWEIDGETVETVSDFIFLGSKITTDGDCSHEIKRRLLLGRKVMTNLDSLFKSRDITLPTKVHLVKAMFFPVVMYGCES